MAAIDFFSTDDDFLGVVAEAIDLGFEIYPNAVLSPDGPKLTTLEEFREYRPPWRNEQYFLVHPSVVVEPPMRSGVPNKNMPGGIHYSYSQGDGGPFLDLNAPFIRYDRGDVILVSAELSYYHLYTNSKSREVKRLPEALIDKYKCLVVSNLNRNWREGFPRRKLRGGFGSQGTRGDGR